MPRVWRTHKEYWCGANKVVLYDPGRLTICIDNHYIFLHRILLSALLSLGQFASDNSYLCLIALSSMYPRVGELEFVILF